MVEKRRGMIEHTTGARPAVTPERMRRGAASAASCLGLRQGDRVVIITDGGREHIAALVAEEGRRPGASATTLRLEDYGQRLLTSCPEQLRLDLQRWVTPPP